MNTVYQMLRLEKYIGICRYDEGVYDNIFPAIVPKQLFDDVKAILAKNKIGSRSGQTDFLLKGKLICGLCGKNMHGESGTSHTGKISHYYKCMARKRNKSCTESADERKSRGLPHEFRLKKAETDDTNFGAENCGLRR